MANSFQPTVLAFLLVGLLVGGGAGYFVSNSSLQAKIDTLTVDNDDLRDSQQALVEQINSKQANVTRLNGEITGLEAQKQGLQTSLSGLTQQMNEKQQSSDELLSEKTSLETQVVPREGYYKFMMYGLSFDYAQDWELDVSGVGQVATVQYGLALATFHQGERDVGVEWFQLPYIENIVENFANAYVTAGSNITIISRVNGTIAGSPAKILLTSNSPDGHFQYSAFGFFYSETDGRLYFVQYNVPTQPELSGYTTFFDSVKVGGVK